MTRWSPAKAYALPPAECLGSDPAANLAFFLMENAGSIWGTWYGPMKAADQRKLFGRFLGKGWVVVDGSNEALLHSVTVCFGTMRDYTAEIPWRDLKLEAA